MRTTAFLTLTGAGTAIREWLTQLSTGSGASPELLLLIVAMLGLGLQTLHSERVRNETHPAPVPPVEPATASEPEATHEAPLAAPGRALSGA